MSRLPLRSFTSVLALAVLLVFAALAGWQVVSAGKASANACAGSCRAAYDACRKRTKGNASCDSAYRTCLLRCIKR